MTDGRSGWRRTSSWSDCRYEEILEHESVLGADLVARCQQLLKERHRAVWREDRQDKAFLGEKGFAKLTWYSQDEACYTWFLTTNWQQRTERLYALAGEVTRRPADAQATGTSGEAAANCTVNLGTDDSAPYRAVATVGGGRGNARPLL